MNEIEDLKETIEILKFKNDMLNEKLIDEQIMNKKLFERILNKDHKIEILSKQLEHY